MRDLTIITTADGSHSLYDSQLNETYHSVHGAVQESIHVFIRHGLAYLHKRTEKEKVEILEVGFGTGLNTLLSAKHAHEFAIRVGYTTIESLPLDESLWSRLNYAADPGSKSLFERIHRSKWGTIELIHDHFELLKLHTRLEDATLSNEAYDLVYFDAFAPGKQPDLWTREQLTRIVKAIRPDGLLVTYCAKGQLKRDLGGLDMEVETLAGPPGKKEMIRARKKRAETSA